MRTVDISRKGDVAVEADDVFFFGVKVLMGYDVSAWFGFTEIILVVCCACVRSFHLKIWHVSGLIARYTDKTAYLRLL